LLELPPPPQDSPYIHLQLHSRFDQLVHGLLSLTEIHLNPS